jgi:hypothetical protein
MNTTYTLTEGNDALNRVLLMMQYELGKTLDEQKTIPSYDEFKKSIKPLSKDEKLKKFMDDERYNNTQKFVDKTAVSFRGPDGKQKSTATSPKVTHIQRFEAPTLSEGLLMARELLFTPGGMTAQIVLSILGAEIGLPIVFEYLDIAIIVNDFSIMIQNWKSSEYKPWTWEWFEHQYNNNKGFALVLEDIAILLTLGFGKLVGKGAKSAWRYFKPISKNIPKVIEAVEKGIVEKTPFIKKLPKKISSFCESKINELKKGIELLKTPKQAARSVVRQMPKAVAAGVLNYGFLIFFDKYIMPKLFGGKTETTELLFDNPQNKYLIDYLVWNNPQYFPNGIKQIAIVSNKDKKMDYFKIDGNNYVIIDQKNYKLKKK